MSVPPITSASIASCIATLDGSAIIGVSSTQAGRVR